jgi:hypothetical protein
VTASGEYAVLATVAAKIVRAAGRHSPDPMYLRGLAVRSEVAKVAGRKALLLRAGTAPVADQGTFPYSVEGGLRPPARTGAWVQRMRQCGSPAL